MILFPAGLYKGDRLSECSDLARLHFPMIAGLVNGFGRLRLDVPVILEEAYGTFRKRPTKEQIASWLREYRDAHLLYVYQVEGEIWGQLCGIPDNALPRYRTATDKRSPAPDPQSLDAFNAAYSQKKRQRAEACSDFVNLAEHFGNIPKAAEHCETFPLVVDVGVAVDVGVGEIQKQVLPFPGSKEANAPAVDAKLREETHAKAVVANVFAHYLEKVGRNANQYSLTEKRERAGLKVYWTLHGRFGKDAAKAEEAMAAAVDGLAADDWNMGRDPKSRKLFVEWEDHLFKDIETVEKRWAKIGWAA